MSDKLEVPRRKVHKNWHVGLNPDPVDRSHPDVHDDELVEEAMAMKSSTARKFIRFLPSIFLFVAEVMPIFHMIHLVKNLCPSEF